MKAGVHQGSVLCVLLVIIVLEALSHEFWDGIPEFSETPNQANFTPTFVFVHIHFPAGDSNICQIFFLQSRLKLLKNT